MASRILLAAAIATTAGFASGQVVISSVVETFKWSDPFGSYGTPPGFEATCEATATFRATQHLISKLKDAPPLGLAPWADAIPFFFGGRPYPGTWDGVDPKGPAREVMKMEYTDVPDAVSEAEKYKAEDEAEASRISAKNGLESYAYSLKNTLSDSKVDEKLDASDKEKLKAEIDKTISWLDENQTATKDEYEAQQKELEGVANPIMMKFYGADGGAGGMPGGMPGGPGGFPGAGAGAHGHGGGDDGPTVEEVD